MKLFSKIDKEILIILISLIVIILFVGFILYKYVFDPSVKIENSAGGAQIEQIN